MSFDQLRVGVARLSAWVDTVARWSAYVAAVGIFAIAALLTVSSLKRYIFQTPIQETEELGGLLFMATTFLALGYGMTQNRHVRLELFWRHLPGRLQDAASLLAYFLVIVAVGALIVQTWATTLNSFEYGNRSVMTEILLWPWRLIMPASLALVLMAALVRFLELGLTVFDPDASSDGQG